MGTGFGSLAKYSLDDFVLGGLTGFLKQSRAIVLNRFGQSRAIVLNRSIASARVERLSSIASAWH
jgi:hypothetical protein